MQDTSYTKDSNPQQTHSQLLLQLQSATVTVLSHFPTLPLLVWELQLRVDGLGSVWSSLTRRAGDKTDSEWLYEAVVVDLESVGLMSSRRLAIQAKVIDGDDAAAAAMYAALDDVTLHPCTDCNSPGAQPITKLA